MLARGAIARAAAIGKRRSSAFEEAAEERPEEWVSHYFLAQLFAGSDPARARDEFGSARERKPLGPRIQELRERLERGGGSRVAAAEDLVD